MPTAVAYTKLIDDCDAVVRELSSVTSPVASVWGPKVMNGGAAPKIKRHIDDAETGIKSASLNILTMRKECEARLKVCRQYQLDYDNWKRSMVHYETVVMGNHNAALNNYNADVSAYNSAMVAYHAAQASYANAVANAVNPLPAPPIAPSPPAGGPPSPPSPPTQPTKPAPWADVVP